MGYSDKEKQKDLDWFEKNKDKIYQKYQCKYVGIHWRKVIAYGNELQAVIEKMWCFENFIVKELQTEEVEQPYANLTDEDYTIYKIANVLLCGTNEENDEFITALEAAGYTLLFEQDRKNLYIGKKYTPNNQ